VPGYVDRHWLLQINVLAGSDDSLQMPGMIIRRRGDYDCIQFLGGCNLLVGTGPTRVATSPRRNSLWLAGSDRSAPGRIELVLK